MLIFGKNTVKEAITKKRSIKTIYLNHEKVLNELPKNEVVKNAKIIVMPLKEMDKMVKGNHQGVIVEINDEYLLDLLLMLL